MPRRNTSLIAAAMIAVSSTIEVQGFTVTSTNSVNSSSSPSCLHVLAPDNDGRMSMDEMRRAREEELEAMGGDPFFLTDDTLLEEEKEEKPDMDGTDMEFPSMSLMGAMNVGGGAASVLSASGEEVAESVDAKDSGEIAEKEEKIEEPSKPKFEWDGTYDEGVYFDG